MFGIGLVVAQVPPPPPPPPPQNPPLTATGSGFISGTVVDAVTGKPIAEATVMMNTRLSAPVGRAGPPAAAAPVLTDSQGRFFFASLPAGLYTAQAGKTGYNSAPFGPIELAEAERVHDWKLKLARQASLAGTLRDETGDPVVGVETMLFRRSVVNGRQAWQIAGRSRSDDRGVFRFGSLTAGDFVVCACNRDPIPFDNLLLTTLGSEPVQLMNVAARALSMGADAVSLDSTLRTWAPAFYQSGTSLARAMRISLAAGEDKINVDFNLSIVRAARVSGRIAGAQGPVQAFSMRLVPEADIEAGAQLLAIPPMLVQPDGRFDFASVPPGQYRLVVVHRPTQGAGGPSGAALAFAGARGIQPPVAVGAVIGGGPQPDPAMWASEPVTVGENGVSGLVVNLSRSFQVTGRVQFIGGAPQPPSQMFSRFNLLMQSVNQSDPLAAMGIAVGSFAPDGTFVVRGALPGKYALTLLANVPGFPTLKSVMVAGMDVTDLPIVIGDKDLTDIVMTYVDTPLASLTVTVNAAPGAVGDDGSILVFPVDRRYWTESSAARRRFRQIAMPSKNLVTTPELPAGDYYVVAVTALDAADWMEGGKLDLLARRAQRVVVGETGKATVEVRR